MIGALDRPATPALAKRPWDLLLIIVFSVVSAWSVIVSLYEPLIVGSHAVAYTEAAAAWLQGGNPWTAGPPDVVFAGPPPMLLPFVPFIPLPELLTRVIWVVGMALLALWTIRRLGLPGYWIVFPPIFQAIVLGHVEIGILCLLVIGGPISGVAMLVKPYAAAATLAERRWSAFIVALALFAISLPILPWGLFIDQIPTITATIARQATDGGSTFGSPLLMLVAVVALASLGFRRGLWLSVPLLWPNAQFMYRTVSVPQLSPIIAVLWAIPIPGVTLAGVLTEAIIRQVAKSRPLPSWLESGLAVSATPLER